MRAPEKSLAPSEGPYRIGLVGGSASGKTAVGKKFERLGAGVIDCDKLGHRAYEPGSRIGVIQIIRNTFWGHFSDPYVTFFSKYVFVMSNYGKFVLKYEIDF